MAFVRRRFQPANLLLGGAKFAREVALGEAGLFAQGGYLQRHIPRLTGLLEPLGEIRVLHLLFEVAVEIGLAHSSFLSCQSRIRSRAVSRSRAGIAWPLFRMPWTAMIRRPFAKNHSTRVLSLPVCRSSNKPPPSALDN